MYLIHNWIEKDTDDSANEQLAFAGYAIPGPPLIYHPGEAIGRGIRLAVIEPKYRPHLIQAGLLQQLRSIEGCVPFG